MSILDQDIDKQIQQHQQKIVELEQMKKDHEKKLECLREFNLAIKSLCEQNSLSESELYVSRSEQIEAWLIEMSRMDNPYSIYTNLKKHFERSIGYGSKRVEKKSSQPKQKLVVGTYCNPSSGEKVEKIKRNPRQLDQWIAEYGFDAVRGWKED